MSTRSKPGAPRIAPRNAPNIAPRADIKRGQATQVIYAALRHDILAMDIPPGSHLDEVRLAERFGTSRTPLREALLRLGADGLVKTLPNRNTVVAETDYATLPPYFEALTLMYRVTTRNAALQVGPAGMDAIDACQADFVAAVKAQDALAMIEANREFHIAIARRAGNPYFTGLFERLLDEGRRILRVYYRTFDDRLPLRYVREHDDMIRALRGADADTADELAKQHARQIVQQIQDYVGRDVDKALHVGL